MRTPTTTAALGAATVAAAAALIAVNRRSRAASTLATTPGARTTGRARCRAPAHVRAGARPEHRDDQPEHRDDQPDPDNYTRAAITIWRVGQRYAQPFDGGEIVGVDDAGYLIGSSPSWGLAGWQPTLFLEELEEVPGGNYERIPARPFAVPAATIARARELADALSHRKEARSSSGPP